jgi:hypothetical protein
MESQEIDERRVKHLEMIQAVVARLGNNAFLIKGWSITGAKTATPQAQGGPNPEAVAPSPTPDLLDQPWRLA